MIQETAPREQTTISTSFANPRQAISGACYLALAIEQLLPADAVVLGVPGSPITETLACIDKPPLRGFSELEELDLARYLAGMTYNGVFAMCVVKHNGFLALQEMLNSMTNHDLRAPLVIVVGDEPGETSQVAVDTRFLCDSHELPLIEPSFEKIPTALAYSLTLSSLLRKPVIYRLAPEVANKKRMATAAPETILYHIIPPQEGVKDYFASEGLALGRSARTRYLLENEAPHLAEYEHLKSYQYGGSPYLVIATGGVTDRVREYVQDLAIDLLEINTPTILEPGRLRPIISIYRRVLVLESWLPYLENKIRALVQQCGLSEVRVLGRMANVDEAPFIVEGNFVLQDGNLPHYLSALSMGLTAVNARTELAGVVDHPFLRVSADCQPQYLKIYQILHDLGRQSNRQPCLSVSTGRTRYAVTGSDYESMVKFMPPMGAEAFVLTGYLDGHPQVDGLAPVMLLGDYTFMHSAWKGVVWLERYRQNSGIKVPTVIIDNGGSMTTGGQGCIPPEQFGAMVIPHWRQCFAGTLSIDDGDKLQEAMASLLDQDSRLCLLVVKF